MPTRLLRDWTDSETVERLDVNAERFFIRLIMKADDFGRYTANTTLLRSNLFPLKNGIRESDVSRWLAACHEAGLIALYVSEKKPFLEIVNFRQRVRASVSKYPAPSPSGLVSSAETTPANCLPFDGQSPVACQTPAHVDVCEDEDEGEQNSFEPPQAAASKPDDPPVLIFETVGPVKSWALTQSRIDNYRELFPNIADALAECKRARLWLDDNPTKRKTAKGMPAFLTRWFGNASNRGGGGRPSHGATRPRLGGVA